MDNLEKALDTKKNFKRLIAILICNLLAATLFAFTLDSEFKLYFIILIVFLVIFLILMIFISPIILKEPAPEEPKTKVTKEAQEQTKEVKEDKLKAD